MNVITFVIAAFAIYFAFLSGTQSSRIAYYETLLANKTTVVCTDAGCEQSIKYFCKEEN